MRAASGSKSAEKAPNRRRVRLRFGLRTLCLFVLSLGLVFGWIGILLNRARQQRQAAANIARLGGTVHHLDRYQVRAPDWMLKAFGSDIFFTASKVEIDNPQLNDDRLEELSSQLAHLPDLEIVNIHRASISDSGLRSLASLRSSVGLGFFFCPITDDGLSHLERFGTSQEMWLIGTNITEQGAARLANALPNCAIMYDSDGQIPSKQMEAHLKRRGPYQGAQ